MDFREEITCSRKCLILTPRAIQANHGRSPKQHTDVFHYLLVTAICYLQNYICDAIKQNESEVEKFIFFLFFWHFLLVDYLSFKLVKTLWRLSNWFLRNSILSN